MHTSIALHIHIIHAGARVCIEIPPQKWKIFIFIITISFDLLFVAEERQPYIEQSQADKQRYAEESAAYRGASTQQGSGGAGSDWRWHRFGSQLPGRV